MQQFVGDTFEGIISSVTGFGIFVELDNGVEGLVHITSLKDDYYDYVESQYALVGTHHKRRYQLGDTVEILLARADLEARSLDFVVKDNCDAAALNMENSQDRKAKAVAGNRKSDSGKDKKKSGKKGKKSGKGSKNADGVKAPGKASAKSSARTSDKAKKDKHRKRKGKRRKSQDIIADFSPYDI